MYIHTYICDWLYELVYEMQKQIFTQFVLVFHVWKFGFWHGKVMELFSEIFVGTLHDFLVIITCNWKLTYFYDCISLFESLSYVQLFQSAMAPFKVMQHLSIFKVMQHLSIFLSVPVIFVNMITQSVYPRNLPNLYHYNICLVFRQLKFNICVRCDMAFIEPMHRNKPNITYLLTKLVGWL